MFLVSLWTGNVHGRVPADLELGHLSGGVQRVRPWIRRARSCTAGWPRSSRSRSGFPLAYAIAFRGGRYKNLLLFLVIAPFFTSFLLRTISWKIILADDGILSSDRSRPCGIVPADFRSWRRPLAVIAGITYNFLPFMTLPLYVALEKIDRRLLEAAKDLYAGPWRQGGARSSGPVVGGLLGRRSVGFVTCDYGAVVARDLLGSHRRRDRSGRWS